MLSNRAITQEPFGNSIQANQSTSQAAYDYLIIENPLEGTSHYMLS